MRVVLAHNYYQQPGGEDQVFEAEGALLESYGHEVYRYSVRNDQVAGTGKLELARNTIWNPESYRTLRDLFRRHRPDIVHVHNTLPLISPAIYDAARAEGAAVVQTLHNFRLLCPKATFFRDGGICEACLHQAFPHAAVRHACYRDSRAASAVVAALLAYHRAKRTYQDKVDAYIALTDFSRQKFIDGGLPANKLHVKGNFVFPDPGLGKSEGDYALFVGRLSEEKGVGVLLDAWRKLEGAPLKIVGGGPLVEQVLSASKDNAAIDYLGYQPRRRVLELMKNARLLVFPSVWYEPFGNVIIEAFAVGLPVVASNIGAASSLVRDSVNGLHAVPGSAADLADKVAQLFKHPAEARRLAQGARADYERKHSAASNYQQLLAIYQGLL